MYNIANKLLSIAHILCLCYNFFIPKEEIKIHSESEYMMKKATTAELKQTNRKTILHYIYNVRKTSNAELARNLGFSRPTIIQCLKELEELKLIEKNGYFESTGGRKADAITFIASSKIAVGIELLKNSYIVAAINLYGDIIKFREYPGVFKHNDTYYSVVCQTVREFIHSLSVDWEHVLGVGIMLQGLISSDGTCVTYGKILNCTGLDISSFTKYLPCPCQMIHDAEAAATIELWDTKGIQNALFLHIRDNLSGAFIVNNTFLKGNELKSGVIEHMTLVENGNACYCGKHGCVESYCSLNALLDNNETIELFFRNLRSGQKEYAKRWNRYLSYLAMAIDNVHMLIDYDIILGGILPRYLKPSDISLLHSLIKERTAFPTDREFIYTARHLDVPNAKGAALPYIREYLDSVLK